MWKKDEVSSGVAKILKQHTITPSITKDFWQMCFFNNLLNQESRLIFELWKNSFEKVKLIQFGAVDECNWLEMVCCFHVKTALAAK